MTPSLLYLPLSRVTRAAWWERGPFTCPRLQVADCVSALCTVHAQVSTFLVSAQCTAFLAVAFPDFWGSGQKTKQIFSDLASCSLFVPFHVPTRSWTVANHPPLLLPTHRALFGAPTMLSLSRTISFLPLLGPPGPYVGFFI